jgi:hypothetical protein
MGGVLLYPFKILATWLHELSHGLIMLLSGVGVDRVVIYRDTSGLAYPDGEANALANAFIASAGYMGTALWGALLLAVTPTARSARIALLVLGAMLVASAFTVISAPPGETFGRWSVAAMGAAFAIAGLFVPGRWRVLTAHFIAVQACVNALLDIRVLLRPSQMVNGQPMASSDAHNMAHATFGTTDRWAVWTWAAIWLAWSLAVLYFALRFSGSRRSASAAPSVPTMELLRDGSDRGARRRSPVTEPGETAPTSPADTAGS